MNCILKVVLFFRFGHQGASLFSKPNAKMAVSGIKRGLNGIKLGRVGPLPWQRVPWDAFGFSATRGPSLFSKHNL